MNVNNQTRKALRTVALHGALLAFAAGTWFVNMLALCLSLTASKRTARLCLRAVVHTLVNFYVSMLITLRMAQSNLDELASLNKIRGGALIVANHPSLLDAPLFLSRVPGLVCVFKSALKQGLLLPKTAKMLGYLSNDGGMDMLRALDVHLKAGEKILVFPEGTRTSKPFLNPFNKGYALAARRAGVPVHLVAIHADSQMLSKHQHILKAGDFPATYRLQLGPVVDPGGFNSVKHLNKYVEDWFRKVLASSLPRARQFLPPNVETELVEGKLRAHFTIPEKPFYCAGHMPDNPLVPAYAQMAWIRELSREVFGKETGPLSYRRLKFVKPLRPGDKLEVNISSPQEGGKVQFNIDGEVATRGTIAVVGGINKDG